MFQIWFWILKRSEKNYYLNKIKELGLEDLKFEKADQFALLDGSVSSNEIFSKYKIMEHIPEFYFFDIGKEDYINHLVKNPPKNEWFNDGMSYNIYEQKGDKYYDYSFIKGAKQNTRVYKSFRELLEDIADFRMRTK